VDTDAGSADYWLRYPKTPQRHALAFPFMTPAKKIRKLDEPPITTVLD
jgi:hypothetical protein